MNARAEFGSNLDLLWATDPRMIGIRAARYKFVAKMLHQSRRVIEIGAGDGLLSRIVAESVHTLVRSDKCPQGAGVIELDATARVDIALPFDGVYALDVLEHVPAQDEEAFMATCAGLLTPHGTCIIGMPSLESQAYASEISKAGHVNCKTATQLQSLLKRYFHNVYLFGMNDETLHTGFGPMCHYRLALCTGKVAA